MSDKIAVTDVKLKYATIQEAKTMSGLRLILGANTVPGPWREACKGMFYVKGVPYTPVASAGQDGSQRELGEWTAQTSAPVAIWNDERPRSTWIEQLYLAERLQPEPALIPANADDRVIMFGLINEIAGENVARQLGISAGHLAVLLFRAKQQLRHCVEDAEAAICGLDVERVAAGDDFARAPSSVPSMSEILPLSPCSTAEAPGSAAEDSAGTTSAAAGPN